MKYPLLAVFLLCSTAACQQNGQTNDTQESKIASANESASTTQVQTNSMQVARQDANADKTENKTMRMSGQIIYQQMEGGFYSFIADDGSKFTPLKLPKMHQRHGLLVELEAKALHDVMTVMQFGTIVEVISVKVLDDSKVTEITHKK